MDFIRRYKGTLRWLAMGYLAVVIVLSVITFVSSYRQQMQEDLVFWSLDLMEDSNEKLNEIEKRTADLEGVVSTVLTGSQIDHRKLELLIKAAERIEELEKDQQTFVSLHERVNKLSVQTNKLAGDFERFRSALNPTGPEDVLMVVRVGDQLKIVLQRVEALGDNLELLRREIREKVSHNDVEVQIDRIVELLKWAGLLLAPTFINTIVTILPIKRQDGEST